MLNSELGGERLSDEYFSSLQNNIDIRNTKIKFASKLAEIKKYEYV